MFGEGFLDLGIARFDGELHCDVSARARELWKGLDLEHVLADAEDLLLVEFGEVDGRLETELACAGRENLSEGADGLAFELNVASEEEAFARTSGELDTAISESRLDGGFEIVEIERAVFAAGP